MKNLLVLLFILTSTLFSHEIIIDDNLKKAFHSHDSKVYITDNIDETINLVKTKKFKLVQKAHFPRSSKIIWTKFKVKNDSKEDKKIFFRNIRAGIDYIDVYILKNNKLLKTILLGDLRSQDDRLLLSKYSAFRFTFKKNSEYEIIFRYQGLGAISNKWEIYDGREFFIQETKENLLWGIIAGLIFSIMIYNLLFYFNTKYKAFLFYILASLFALGYILSLNGVIYQLNLGINVYFITIFTWISIYFFFIFMFIFIIKFFDEKKDSLSYKTIIVLLWILSIKVFLLCVGFYNNDYHYIFTKLDGLALFTVYFILIFAVIEFYKKRTSESIYFLIGQTIYISTFTYYILQVIGVLPLLSYSWLILPIGLCFEIIFISIALNVKLKNVEKEKEKLKEQYLEHSRFVNAGKTVSYIVHQLKNPIAQLGSHINLIEAVLLLDRKNLVTTVEKKMPSIKATLEYVNDVSHSVSTLFTNPNGKENFSLKKQISTLLLLQKDYLDKYSINIEQKFNIDEVVTFRGTFSNVFMVILENAIYELKSKEYEKFIYIRTYKSNDFFYVTIRDNAGGVQDLKKIFDNDYSKKDSDGSGIGLSLAQMLTNEKLNGELSVTNTRSGAMFVIKVPIESFSLEESKL